MANGKFDFDKLLKRDKDKPSSVNFSSGSNLFDELNPIVEENSFINELEQSSNQTLNEVVESNNFDVPSIDLNNIPEVGLNSNVEEEVEETENTFSSEVLVSNINEELSVPELSVEDNNNNNNNNNNGTTSETESSEISQKEFNELNDLVLKAIDLKVVEKSGSYYEIPGEENSRFRGINQFIEFLYNKPSLVEEIKFVINNNDRIKEFSAKEEVKTEKEENKNIIKNNQEDLSSINNINVDNSNTADLILSFVSKKTIENLSKNYKSEMYTEKYTNALFEKWLNGDISSTNVLFRELISEILESNVVDPYLGEDFTNIVLKHILNN